MECINFVSVVIANWNGEKWLKKCLDSLQQQTYKNFEIIFVDNNSTDRSVLFVKNNYPKIKIVKNKKNLGFGVANNIGVENCRGDILFFLNNDTGMDPDTLEKLVKFKIDFDLNIVGPRLVDFEKNDPLDGKFLQIDFVGSPGGPNKRLFYIEGCALMISREDFLKIGGFDEKYFMYGEDIDLCWRAQIYGMKLEICETTNVLHFGGGSSQKTQFDGKYKHSTSYQRRLWVESHTLRSLLKNYSIINLFWTIPFFVGQNIGESLIYFFTGNFKMVLIIWKSIFWNIKNFSNTMKKRKIIQNNRKVEDKKIFLNIHKGFYKWKAFMIIGMPKFK